MDDANSTRDFEMALFIADMAPDPDPSEWAAATPPPGDWRLVQGAEELPE